ncbi:uncharacterized protein T069G_11313 [Trichoderma breve]|uniref:S-formylglutathione hydrolase n=1 Tax=Trichoderma breve TaxID=2034170 RepID=A0A9W9B4T1_9HYPO|nr:uncharacterized protein T069G_11313 [Trichoderma breve]KAJ4854334.1 hypothetical protein T069G_11313 [Trichoderma breve]
MGGFTTNATIKSFGGRFLKLSHRAFQTRSTQNFTLFILPGASVEKPAPLLIYLLDLTCSLDDVTEKGFLHAYAALLGLALLYLDTLPRGLNLLGEHDAGDFGSRASYVPCIYRRPLDGWLRCTYFVSEVAGKAFEGYLGEDREVWKKHDATELVKSWKGGSLNCLIDVGTDDNFYKQGQLLPENFETAVKETDLEGLELRYQDGYDHSYFFISTFGADHVKHAAKALGLF